VLDYANLLRPFSLFQTADFAALQFAILSVLQSADFSMFESAIVFVFHSVPFSVISLIFFE
jgi:hypothetical protein